MELLTLIDTTLVFRLCWPKTSGLSLLLRTATRTRQTGQPAQRPPPPSTLLPLLAEEPPSMPAERNTAMPQPQ